MRTGPGSVSRPVPRTGCTPSSPSGSRRLRDPVEVVKGLTVLGGLFGAAGAWGGYAVDRMIRREEAVYRPSSGLRLSVAPVLSPDRRGVAVSLGF